MLTYPLLTLGFGMPPKIANATNSVSLWPGSLGGAIGFRNLLPKTAHYLKQLFLPTLVGSCLGAVLFMNTSEIAFQRVVPVLVLFAAALLFVQPKVKELAERSGKLDSPLIAFLTQLFVAAYGGYFGAGMGIMMLASFAVYMKGTIHELNAVKSWLGVIINLACSLVFVTKGLIDVQPAIALTLGSVVGGFAAAKLSQRLNPEKLRLTIAIYGVAMATYFAYQAWK